MLEAEKDQRRGGAEPRDPVRTRQRLLQAAFQEIYHSGFQGSDLEAILDRAGVTKGALYHHFENKEALGYAVVDEVITTMMRDKWLRPLEHAQNPIDALAQIVRSTSTKPEWLHRGCPINNLSQEMSPLDEGFRKRLASRLSFAGSYHLGSPRTGVSLKSALMWIRDPSCHYSKTRPWLPST
jgi:AcrR family transcriptional regulator